MPHLRHAVCYMLRKAGLACLGAHALRSFQANFLILDAHSIMLAHTLYSANAGQVPGASTHAFRIALADRVPEKPGHAEASHSEPNAEGVDNPLVRDNV
eukprot:1141024-Pelagomonas_calceolata.AAC.4